MICNDAAKHKLRMERKTMTIITIRSNILLKDIEEYRENLKCTLRKTTATFTAVGYATSVPRRMQHWNMATPLGRPRYLELPAISNYFLFPFSV